MKEKIACVQIEEKKSLSTCYENQDFFTCITYFLLITLKQKNIPFPQIK